MIWHKKEIDTGSVKRMHEQYRIDLLTASILARRGITDDLVRFYLEDDISFLHNPFLFEDMESAVDRIRDAASEGEKIRIFGDRDVDGMTSTVLLKQALDGMGIDADWRVPLADEPYGLTMAGVDAMSDDGRSLLITVDCGISNCEEISYAASLGIDAIVVDHHLPSEMLPAAVAIINPKVPGSGYPFTDLAGCGVVAKLIWALSFSSTEWYKQEIVLLHAHPGNETIVIEAVKLENLVEIDRITEHIVPGILPAEQSRLYDFLIDRQILVYDEPVERHMLQEAFGKNVEIGLFDLSRQVSSVFPSLKGKSLLRIQQKSKAARYGVKDLQEIDTLVSLFSAFVERSCPSLSTEYEKNLDLVAIGTVADLMPMHGENRILVKKGLEIISRGNRSSLLMFLSHLNLDGKRISTTNIGWQISPVFNASGRLGVPDKTVHMLLSTESEQQKELSMELIRLNKKRKKMGEESWQRILPKAKTSFSEHDGKIVIVYDSKVNRGITGVMAARLMNTFKVPAMVIAKIEHHLVGSMRSSKGMNVKLFLSELDDILLDHGGHPCAGGFSLLEKDLDEFMIRVDELSGDLKCQTKEEPLIIDAVLPQKYMSPEIIDLVERLEPYGVDYAPLQFMLKQAVIEELSLIGAGEQKHVKMLLSYGSYRWPAIYWRAGDKVGVDFTLGDTVDLVFRLGRNYYKNMESLQLTVLDIVKDADSVLTKMA